MQEDLVQGPELIEAWRSTIQGADKSWVLFENGTCVILMQPQADLAVQATALLREFGPVQIGTSSGDFDSIELENGCGWVVTCHHSDILSLVGHDEADADSGDLVIGLLGRGKRDQDAQQLRVLHVEDRRPGARVASPESSASVLMVRAAEADELDALARLWHDAWRDAHAHLMPPELVLLRTFESFRERLAEGLASVRATGPLGAPSGFCMIHEEELYQLFVAAHARGSGVAAILLADGEARLAAAGVRTAWLACAIGNERAARFYEKNGWQRRGVEAIPVVTSDGPFPLDVWRYEKTL